MYKKLLTSFLLQLKEYVNQLTIIRCNVLLCISQYVTEVDNGRPLSKLPPLVIPPLPDFPSLTPLSLPPMLNSNPDQSTAAPQPLYTNPAQLHNFNGQLLSPNITHMQNVDSAQLPNQTAAQLPNPNAIFSNFSSTQLSNLNSSLLKALNSTQLHLNPKSTAFASAALPTSIFPFSASEVNNKYSAASRTSSGPPGLETLHTSVNTSSSSELPIPSVLPVTSGESSNEPVSGLSRIELPSSADKSSLKTEDVSEQSISSSSTAQPLTGHLCQQESSKVDVDLPISLTQCEDAGLTANTKCAMTEAKSFSNISSSSSLSSLHSVEYSKLQESKEIFSAKDSETICQSLQNNNELTNAMGARPKTFAINHIDDLELESSMASQHKNLELTQKSSGPSKSSACDSNNSEAMSIELGYTLKSEEPSSTESVSKNKEMLFLNVQHAQQCKPQNREKKNCYEKLLVKLQSRYPRYSQSELMHYVKEFRKQQNNKLSGLTLESIVNGVSSIISRIKKEDSAIPTPPRSRSRPSVLVNKSTVPSKHIPSVKPATTGECPWAKTPINSLPQWTGSGADKNCIICLEDMTWNVYRTDCGHRFHSNCIRAWLNKNSTCPICRVYILLPDEFPALG